MYVFICLFVLVCIYFYVFLRMYLFVSMHSVYVFVTNWLAKAIANQMRGNQDELRTQKHRSTEILSVD